jgi:hypothetical protein
VAGCWRHRWRLTPLLQKAFGHEMLNPGPAREPTRPEQGYRPCLGLLRFRSIRLERLDVTRPRTRRPRTVVPWRFSELAS